MGPTAPDAPTGVEPNILAVYDADGGLVGEARYVLGKFLGTRHCALCSVTHTWRRKPSWDAMVDRVGLQIDLRHLNEIDQSVTDAVRAAGAPVVLVRRGVQFDVALSPDQLDALDGSVDAFEHALLKRLDELGVSRTSA